MNTTIEHPISRERVAELLGMVRAMDDSGGLLPADEQDIATALGMLLAAMDRPIRPAAAVDAVTTSTAYG